jgi:tRNA pseudouridine13 synthase
VFNRCLDARLGDDAYDRLLPGDLAWLHASGALYAVESETAEAGRAARFEASPSGPLPGYDLRRPAGRPLEAEAAVLREEGVDEEAFRSPLVRTRGARRPYRVPLTGGSIEPAGASEALVRFALPPGSFATVVLDELMKTGTPPPAGGGDAGETELEEAPDVPEGA